MASDHARRRSFDRYANLSIASPPVDGLAAKRAALARLIATPPSDAASNAGQQPPAPCIVIPADTKCPRSFGNRHQNALSALMTAIVLQARVRVDVDAIECHSLLGFKMRERMQQNVASSTSVKLGVSATCGPLAVPSLPHDGVQCVQPQMAHGQLTAWCSQQRRSFSAAAPLFALGPHAAFGAVFDAAFELKTNANSSSSSSLDSSVRDDEIRIAVHARHFEATQTGGESLGAFEAAIKKARGRASRRCALLVASDRRLALSQFEEIARRLDCRLLASTRGSSTRDYDTRHGEDTGEVVLRDVALLGQGHVLVGTWGSTMTLLIQELIAARSVGFPVSVPTVTYCDTLQDRCLNPLPLLATERSSQWYATIGQSGGMRIASNEALEHAKEWAEWGALQQQDAPTLRPRTRLAAGRSSGGSDGVAGSNSSCQVSLLEQLGNRTLCVFNKTFGCQYGGSSGSGGGGAMWVSRGCRGRFSCGDVNLFCGRQRSMRHHVCSCQVADGSDVNAWPTVNETVAMLDEVISSGGSARTPPPAVATTKWLAAIISGSTSSQRFVATADAAMISGGVVRHVPAAMPSDYRGRSDMVRDLFGLARRHIMRLSPHEIGLLISHKRALRAIALSEFAWGAVLEDDACLHEAVRPEQAGQLLAAAFAAADVGPRRSRPALLYIGSCNPRCDADSEARPAAMATDHPLSLASGLLRAGRCQAYCTHAYALSRAHAATFFADVFGCHNGTAGCGYECEFRPCFMDWAMSRHFKREGEAWIVGGGLQGKWVANHRGLFIQNRSRELGNAVSGTGLGKRFRWSNDSAYVEEQKCERGIDLAATNATKGQQLHKVLIHVKWSGRLGNLLFELAMLAGMVKRLQASIETVEAVTFGLPSSLTVPVKELFEQFPLRQLVSIVQEEEHAFESAYSTELAACEACKLGVEERFANAFDAKLVDRLTEWVASPPRGCTLGLIDLKGYFQSFLYFDGVADRLLRETLLTASAQTAAQRKGESILEGVRRSLPVVANGQFKLIGVQVRLGDKARNDYFQGIYAATSWDYYLTAMRELSTKFMREGAAGVAFIVTAGGSMGDNAEDIADAQKHLQHGRIFFSSNESPYVDLAILRKCDALVIGPSTFGWWAAYLANLPEGHVIAPKALFNPNLPKTHNLVKGFHLADYYPAGWKLLANDAGASVKATGSASGKKSGNNGHGSSGGAGGRTGHVRPVLHIPATRPAAPRRPPVPIKPGGPRAIRALMPSAGGAAGGNRRVGGQHRPWPVAAG